MEQNKLKQVGTSPRKEYEWEMGKPDDMVGTIGWTFLPKQMVFMDGKLTYIN